MNGRFDYFKRVERLDRSTLACPVQVQWGAEESEWLGCGSVGIAGDDDCNKVEKGEPAILGWDGFGWGRAVACGSGDGDKGAPGR